jgi:GT2 family glycosyltransferase
MRASQSSYSKWIKLQEGKPSSKVSTSSAHPEVTFLVSVGVATLEAAKTTIKSIQHQRSGGWQALLVNSRVIPEAKLAEAFSADARVTTLDVEGTGIEQALALVASQFIVCCTPGDVFSSSLLDYFYFAHGEAPDAGLYFYDQDEKTDLSASPIPFFKPSRLSPELLLSTDYLSDAIIEKNIAEQVAGKINPHLDFTHQARELLFLLAERNVKMQHIPQVLVHKIQPQDDDGQTEQVIRSHMARTGIDGANIEHTGQGTRVRWDLPLPPVSIIIPTKNNPGDLKTLLNSIFSLTQYPDYEILLVDNASDDPETLAYYESLTKDQKVRIIPFDEAFNYSRAINLGAAASRAELLLFLNNDMQVLHSDWLRELVQWAMQPQIGVVGAKLLHPDRTIQHAGVVIGLQGFMGHLYLNVPDHYYGLLGSVDWYRNVSAVTGACQIIRRSVFEELGGYDEKFQLVFNDIDICLRAIQKGYRVLYDPFAALVHFEGRSRGYKTPLGDIVRGYEKLEDWLLHDDPYFSPNLTYTTIPRCQLKPYGEDKRMEFLRPRRDVILKAYRSHSK